VNESVYVRVHGRHREYAHDRGRVDGHARVNERVRVYGHADHDFVRDCDGRDCGHVHVREHVHYQEW